MKILNLFICLLIAQLAYTQVAIEKENVDGSAILDFKENTNKGLILPMVSNPIAEIGSLIFDTNQKKVMFFDGTKWQDLSIKEGFADTTKIDAATDIGQGVIIGNPNTNRQGVLVLSDDSKALVLPKNINPWENILNPAPGTITYDTVSKTICIYNGKEWTFWGI